MSEQNKIWWWQHVEEEERLELLADEKILNSVTNRIQFLQSEGCHISGADVKEIVRQEMEGK